MWPFKKKVDAVVKEAPEYRGVRFGNWKYEPQEDITPYEVSLIFPLFMPYSAFNRQAYIDKYGLRRHFKEIKDESVSRRD